jgi:hypothetical protein
MGDVYDFMRSPLCQSTTIEIWDVWWGFWLSVELAERLFFFGTDDTDFTVVLVFVFRIRDSGF